MAQFRGVVLSQYPKWEPSKWHQPRPVRFMLPLGPPLAAATALFIAEWCGVEKV
jgi:hypothetical protein